MIENELKYVLVDGLSRSDFRKFCGKPVHIRQGYLPGKGRIRSKTDSKGEITYYFTYKLWVDTVLFEIEKKITSHEFDTLWPHTDRRLIKDRFMYMDGNVQWDIDFFYEDGSKKYYFAMAEAEMPEDMLEPERVPIFLLVAMRYPVPRELSKEFTSSRLSDPDYARSKTAELLSQGMRSV